MEFQEFSDILTSSKQGSAWHFKPYGEPVLNAHHPEVKDDVFCIVIRGKKFEIIYPQRDDAPHEKVSKVRLKQIFKNRNWNRFLLYNPDTDMLDWIEHPVWGLYI